MGSIDSNAAKYVAAMGVQTGRQEEIDKDDLTAMCKVYPLLISMKSTFDSDTH